MVTTQGMFSEPNYGHHNMNTDKDDWSRQQNTIAKQLRTMPFDSFFDLILNVFVTVIRSIQSAATYHQLLCQLVEECMDAQGFDKNARVNIQALVKESAETVFAAADMAHTRCAKLIGFRSEQNAQLNPTDFYRLASVLRIFIQRSEALCKRTCYGLRGTVLSQVRSMHYNLDLPRCSNKFCFVAAKSIR